MANRKKPLVVVTRKLPDRVETRMRELFDAQLNLDDKPMTQAELGEMVKSADVLVPTVTDRIDSSVLSRAGEKLKLIANYGNGVDHIDVATALSRGITVTNTPGVLTEDTADMTMALILSVPRRLAEGATVLSEDKPWNGWSPTWMLGHRIWGKRLGIIGMGRIGQAVARRARAFGLQIHYHNRRRVPAKVEEEITATYWESLDQMLARMDIISVNCPHTPATYHLLSARRLKLLRPEAYVVNTARGEVIDENALARMIEAGELAGAALDVYEHEPAVNPKLQRLARAGKVVLLPHMGSATMEGRIDMGEKVIINIRTFMDGHRPPDRVLPSMLGSLPVSGPSCPCASSFELPCWLPRCCRQRRCSPNPSRSMSSAANSSACRYAERPPPVRSPANRCARCISRTARPSLPAPA
jgi:glyoxylate reductase